MMKPYLNIGLLIFAFSLFLGLNSDVTHAQTSCSSGGTGDPVTLTFVNTLDVPVTYAWENYECDEVPYGIIPAGGSIVQESFDGHNWVFTDTTSDFTLNIVASSDDTTITIAAELADTDSQREGGAGQSEGASGAGEVSRSSTIEPCEVQPVTDDMELDPFYTQYCTYSDLLIISSDQVDPQALEIAWDIIHNMIGDNVEPVDTMASLGIRVGIIGADEGTTDMPEYSDLDEVFPFDDGTTWNERARGLGATLERPLVSAGEENLFCSPDDRYFGESIFIHEFAHSLKTFGFAMLDDTVQTRLEAAYEDAVESGVWDDTYAIINSEEYWSEGVQSYFNTNLEAIPADGIHNAINTREELEAADPALFSLIDELFDSSDYSYSCPETE